MTGARRTSTLKPTCQSRRVSKCSHLGIGQPGQQRDDIVHEVLVVDDGILTLLHQDLNKVAEVVTELLPRLSGHDQGVFSTFLESNSEPLYYVRDQIFVLATFLPFLISSV